jgi:hypothetical protein
MLMTPDDITNELIFAARNGNANDVRRFIPLCDPKYNHSEALCAAAENGHAECVALLILLSDPKAQGYHPLRLACMNNHIECVRLFLQSTPNDDKSLALHECVKHQHLECLELLIPFCALHAHNGLPLRTAAHEGYTQGVRLLIPLTDLKARTGALVEATSAGHVDCMEVLYPVSDPLEALRRIQDIYPQATKRWQALERMIAQEQNDTLCAAVGDGRGHKGSARKM